MRHARKYVVGYKGQVQCIYGLLALASWFGTVMLAVFSTMELAHKREGGK